MSSPPPSAPGFIGALHALGENLVATVEKRLELVSVELQEEKLHLIRSFIWISLIVFAGLAAFACVCIALILACPVALRPALLGGLAGVLLLTFVVSLRAFRLHLATAPRPFAASIEELGKDRACIRAKN
jgi:uncharacterized membrane protein YqjE